MNSKELHIFMGKFFRRYRKCGEVAGAICQQENIDLHEAEFTVLESVELMAKIMELVRKTSHENGKKISTYQLSQILKALEKLTNKAG